MAKRLMQDIVAGLTTTSDKIRALLREGYLRAEVAAFLEIRYQHVRKVAIDAGIEGGLQRGIVVLPPQKLKSNIKERIAIDFLVDAGFKKLGHWVAKEGGISLFAPVSKDPGVYAFVVDDQIMYVGITRKGFHRRMYNYQRGHHRQRTSHRINGIITEQITAGVVVDIYGATPPALEWNGLPVNAAAGLEAGLIELIQPPWNKMGIEPRI
ncbi:GIY-YIG nuclease family protein [Xanthobacter sp.]|uniref:GIY-YIG nuclease family protein n=1 Tax=Xanthobacter sp. TaxID=35809 RepID=UPI0025F38BAD|nr:GIY-YIG nuclease family protein [Xanthobacter sp.]